MLNIVLQTYLPDILKFKLTFPLYYEQNPALMHIVTYSATGNKKQSYFRDIEIPSCFSLMHNDHEYHIFTNYDELIRFLRQSKHYKSK